MDGLTERRTKRTTTPAAAASHIRSKARARGDKGTSFASPVAAAAGSGGGGKGGPGVRGGGGMCGCGLRARRPRLRVPWQRFWGWDFGIINQSQKTDKRKRSQNKTKRGGPTLLGSLPFLLNSKRPVQSALSPTPASNQRSGQRTSVSIYLFDISPSINRSNRFRSNTNVPTPPATTDDAAFAPSSRSQPGSDRELLGGLRGL